MVGKLTAAANAGATNMNGRGAGTRGDGEFYTTQVSTSRGRGNPSHSAKRVRNASSGPAPQGMNGVSYCAPRGMSQP